MDTVKDALDKVKETELKAHRIVEQAKDESLGIIQKAKLERERIIEEAKGRARIDSQKLRVKMEEGASREAAVIKKQSKDNSEILKRKAEDNLDRAVKFIRAKIGL